MAFSLSARDSPTFNGQTECAGSIAIVRDTTVSTSRYGPPPGTRSRSPRQFKLEKYSYPTDSTGLSSTPTTLKFAPHPL